MFNFNFKAPTIIRLGGKPVELKPKDIQIIGDFCGNESLGGDNQSRRISRFAQRSMMHSLVPYTSRTDSKDLKCELYLAVEFEFEGPGSTDRHKLFATFHPYDRGLIRKF